MNEEDICDILDKLHDRVWKLEQIVSSFSNVIEQLESSNLIERSF